MTICTPLDFVTLGAEEVEVSEGRGIPFTRGVLGAGSLDGELEVGGVLFAPGVVGAVLARLKPARESRAARPCPEDADEEGREVGRDVEREPNACGKAGTAPRSGTVFMSDK